MNGIVDWKRWSSLKREHIYTFAHLAFVCDEHILGISLRVITDEMTKFCMYYLNYTSLILHYLHEDVEQ
jgi:hypothetical protein